MIPSTGSVLRLLVAELRPEAQTRKGLPWTLAELETLERIEAMAK